MLDMWIQTGLAVFLSVLAAWVLAARPGEPRNRTLGALLLLLAGSSYAYGRLRTAQSPAQAVGDLHLIYWFEIPAILLTFVLLEQLFLPAPRTPRRRLVLGAGVAVVAALLTALVLSPDLFLAAIAGEPRGPTSRGFNTAAGPLGHLYGVAERATHAAALFAGALVARSPHRTLLQRRQAALIAIAFGFLAGHNGVGAVLRLVQHGVNGVPPSFQVLWLAALGAVGVLGLGFAARPVTGVFEGRARAAAAVALVVPVFAAVADYVVVLWGADFGWAWSESYRNARPFMLCAFGLALAAAIVRFGLAGILPRARTHLARVTGVLAAGVVGGGLAAVVAPRVAPGVPTMALAFVAFMAGGSLTFTPLRRAPQRWAARFLLDPADPDVHAERMRIYSAALRETAADRLDPRAVDGAAPLLRALREEMALTDRDHAICLALLHEAARSPAQRVLLGRYVVRREIGRGGVGAAYLAHDPLVDRDVVVKRVRPDGGAQHVLREMRALGRLNHPRVVTLYAAETVGDEVFLVLEHVSGGHVEAGTPMDPGRAVRIVVDVLEALAAVHAAGLVHGDVKPTNVLLSAEGRAKLADFGTARRFRGRVGQATGSDTSGTLSATAPEQAAGHGPSPASDVYAAGVLLYRLLTGEHPLGLEGVSGLRARAVILRGDARLPHPRVPVEVEPVLRRALERDPGDRFGSAAEMRAALLVLGGSVRGGVRGPPLRRPPGTRGGWSRRG